MDTSAFFARKRQELQASSPQSHGHAANTVPWWQDPEYTRSNRDQPTEPIETVNEQHDFSRADHLRSSSSNCPNCNSASFMKPSASAAARCFDCGYIQGREVNDLDTLNIMAPSTEARTLKVRQTADGGAQKYRARISRNASDIRQANAELEQSYTGRMHSDS